MRSSWSGIALGCSILALSYVSADEHVSEAGESTTAPIVAPSSTSTLAASSALDASIARAMRLVERGGSQAALWSPSESRSFADSRRPKSVTVMVSPKSYVADLWTTDKSYPVNEVPVNFQGVSFGEWAAQRYPSASDALRAASSWPSGPCWGDRPCQRINNIAITKTVSGVIYSAPKHTTNLRWRIRSWQVQCDVPGYDNEAEATALAREILRAISTYPLPVQRGTVSVTMGADNRDTDLWWTDGASVIRTVARNPEDGFLLASEMRPVHSRR
jgi:hypothetical protein